MNHGQVDKSRAVSLNVQFGIVSTSSIRFLLLDTQIRIVKFYFVEVDTFFLL